MKKIFKIALGIFSIIPISLPLFSCLSNKETSVSTFDKNDASSVKWINWDNYEAICESFWKDIVKYNGPKIANEEMYKQNVDFDLRVFKNLKGIESSVFWYFSEDTIFKWRSHFESKTTEEEKSFLGKVNYILPSSLEFIKELDKDYIDISYYSAFIDHFFYKYLTVDFNNANLKVMPVLTGDKTTITIPSTIENIVPISNNDTWFNSDEFSEIYSNVNKITFPASFTFEKLQNQYENDSKKTDVSLSLLGIPKGYFCKWTKKEAEADHNYLFYSNQYGEIISGDSLNERDKKIFDSLDMINNRLNSSFEIQLSKTFEGKDDKLYRYLFGAKLLDEELEWLKSHITYIQ